MTLVIKLIFSADCYTIEHCVTITSKMALAQRIIKKATAEHNSVFFICDENEVKSITNLFGGDINVLVPATPNRFTVHPTLKFLRMETWESLPSMDGNPRSAVRVWSKPFKGVVTAEFNDGDWSHREVYRKEDGSVWTKAILCGDITFTADICVNYTFEEKGAFVLALEEYTCGDSSTLEVVVYNIEDKEYNLKNISSAYTPQKNYEITYL